MPCLDLVETSLSLRPLMTLDVRLVATRVMILVVSIVMGVVMKLRVASRRSLVLF